MEKEINDLELVESYLAKKLNDTEKQQFEERLQTDEEFATLFKELQWIIPGIEQSSRKNLKQELADYAKELSSYSDYSLNSDIDLEKDFGLQINEIDNPLKVSHREVPLEETVATKKPTVLSWQYGIAAAITFFLAATFLFLNKTQPEKAFNLAYNEVGEGAYTFLADSETPPPLNRGSVSQKSQDAEEQAYMSYQALDYKEAIKNFEQAKAEVGQQDPKFLFYMGNAYLANEQASKAITVFKELLKLPDNLKKDFIARTKWYLAISHLKNEDLTQAKTIFEDLVNNTEGSYQEKAKEVLEAVNWGLF